jgi:hypothetical protein
MTHDTHSDARRKTLENTAPAKTINKKRRNGNTTSSVSRTKTFNTTDQKVHSRIFAPMQAHGAWRLLPLEA